MSLIRTLGRCALLLFPFAWLQALSLVSGSANDGMAVAERFVAILLLLAAVTAARWLAARRRSVWWLAALTACIALAYFVAPRTPWLWLAIGAWFSLIAWVDMHLQASAARWWWRWAGRLALCVLGGIVPVAVAQVQSAFADEEFFALVQALGLGAFYLVLICAAAVLQRVPAGSANRAAPANLRWVLLGALLFVFAGAAIVTRSYQNSFYTQDAPSFPGISAGQPAACTTVDQQTGTASGVETFQRLLRAVAANPDKTPAEFGMLALGRNDPAQAELFRRSLLSEAQIQRYTQPMGSVKWGQFEAALRVYYFSKVRTQFPLLFSASDEQTIRSWFASINRRALAPEWVDWAYALAFSKWPEGPYENQENGAGLLALLEASGMGDPALSARNRAYLDSDPRGWAARFHNTDDAYYYQAHWLNNALFQSLYAPALVSDTYRRQSFELLERQSLPEGAQLAYNFSGRPWAIGAYYLGAVTLKDPAYVWLASRALDQLESSGGFLAAQPGIESAVDLTGTAPLTGSCLLFSDSGLPNQIGPLAPDKLVMRDGWDAAASYLLLNLRFTGWHRYKATNDLIEWYSGGPLIAEQAVPSTIAWLPQGRDALRDKRVPRENLNGLQIPANGLPGIFSVLGLGDRWAQDPPAYSDVTEFASDAIPQTAQSAMTWDGWTYTRTIYFYSRGLSVIVDSAEGGEGHAAVSWHAVGSVQSGPAGITLRPGAHPAKVIILSEGGSGVVTRPEQSAYGPGQSIVYYAPTVGSLHTITVLLSGPWATAAVTTDPSFRLLTIRSDTDVVELSIKSK